MPFIKSLPEKSGPGAVFAKFPQIYGLWSQLSQELMNGPSPLSQGEREMILAFAAGAAGCKFVYAAHSEVAYGWGIAREALEGLMKNVDTAPVDAKLKPLMKYVHKLATAPSTMTQADVDAVLAAGWEELALHHAIAITARAAFMQRVAEGYGFTPMTPEVAAAQMAYDQRSRDAH